jgi:flagellar biosynthesis protein FlhF
MIIRTEVKELAFGRGVEIVASSEDAVDAFCENLGGTRTGLGDPATGDSRIGPYIIALVGPGGGGKTSTAVKLALSSQGLGGRKVGFLTLDTYRVGAVTELQTYAEITGLPLEVVYNRRELSGAAVRLRGCDVIVVDTPGRVPKDSEGTAPWHNLLREIRADETHFVVPSGMRVGVALSLSSSFSDLGVTHLLPTKLDEVQDDGTLAALAEALRLPVRWVTDGQEIPGGLRAAGPKILTSLGKIVTENTRMAAAG